MNSVRRILWLCVAALLAFSLNAWSQDQQSSQPPLELGGFQTQGSATFGYRFTDIKGRLQKYNELFNLQQGPRLMDFSLFGRTNEGAGRFADRWTLDLNGMGGDPFPTARFSVSKEKVYDLTVTYRRDYYYWDRNDSVIVPNIATGSTAPGYALTNNHDWATTRRFASVDLTIHATRNLRFGFQYQRNTRDGMTFTTNALDFFGSPGSWGSFSRANPYYVEAPVDQASNRVTGSIDYAVRGWNFHYRVGYQRFNQSILGNCLTFVVTADGQMYVPCSDTSPERSINVNDPATAAELANSILYQESRQLTTPVSEFSYDGKIGSRVSLRGGYIFYRYQGPYSRQMSFGGTNRAFEEGYGVTETDRADVSEPNHIIDQGFTVTLTDWLSFSTDYRYKRLTQDATGVFHSVLNTSTISDETQNIVWRIGTHILTSSFTIVPLPSLIIRPGVTFMKNDIFGSSPEEGPEVADDIHTRSIKTASPMISVYYRPVQMFSVRADYKSTDNGVSYTRVSPHIDKSGRFVFRVQPTSKLAIEDALFVRNRSLLDQNCENFAVLPSNCFESNARTNATNVTYSFNNNLALFGGFSYDSYMTKDTIFYYGALPDQNGRGVGPWNQKWTDQFINRVWQGGLSVKAPKYFGANFSGNFVRTTGYSDISGEPVKTGPLIWPMITGTFWFEFPRIGRLSLDLQRTYYAEEILQTNVVITPNLANPSLPTYSPGVPFHANDFSANLLTIRWTKDF